ncbi:hypothetical protein HT667_02680 [Ursidibacter maritimus]|uniref:hypothetical protein n=1 Tax=Ursidibacter maritimus TaxID=1331689 RepID=UPI001C47A5FD|nr:hypothetical protein [Ursidibacter maritimus]MBV6540378.1 hypothetical protein [Ursidibacter maritimus]
MFGFFKKQDEEEKNKLETITRINRLINAGASRDYVVALSAIWYVQASNDPNTLESQKLVPGILGILEHLFVEEAKAVDDDVYQFFIKTIQISEYKALFYETQSIFDTGRKEIQKQFPSGRETVAEVCSYYANVILNTTKQQDKKTLCNIIMQLWEKIDTLCGLANKAEKDLF